MLKHVYFFKLLHIYHNSIYMLKKTQYLLAFLHLLLTISKRELI